MAPQGTVRAGPAVRRATATASAATLLLHCALLRVGEGTFRHGAAHPVAVVAVLTAIAPALALPVLLLPALVRSLAHPRAVPMPDRAVRATAVGAGAVLGCLAVALPLTAAAALARPDLPALAALALAAPLTVLALLQVRQVRAGLRDGEGDGDTTQGTDGAARGAGRTAGGRPDLVDDLSTLVSRLAPGSAPARGLARLNRALDRRDRRGVGPVRRRARAVSGQRSVVTPVGPSGLRLPLGDQTEPR
jgi:hypothetical protein